MEGVSDLGNNNKVTDGATDPHRASFREKTPKRLKKAGMRLENRFRKAKKRIIIAGKRRPQKNNAIYTEDDDSVERLEEKIARFEKLQQTMNDRNKIVGNKKLSEDAKIAKLVETGMTEKEARNLLLPDVCNDIGYAVCYLTNNSETIRNAKKRLERV